MRTLARRRIWFVGDSLTAGYDADYFSECFRARVMNGLHAALDVPPGTITSQYSAGYGGTIANCINAFLGGNGFAPDIVVVQVGENDTASETFEVDYDLLLQQFTRFDRKPFIVCCGLWNPSGNNATLDGYIQSALQANSPGGGAYISLAALSETPANISAGRDVAWLGDGGHLTSDTFHPNSIGHKAIADALLAVLIPVMTQTTGRSASTTRVEDSSEDTIAGFAAYSTSKTNIKVDWDASVKPYTVEVQERGKSSWTLIATQPSGTTLSIAATAGTQYFVRMKASTGAIQTLRAQTYAESSPSLTGNGRHCLYPDGRVLAQIDTSVNKLASSADGGKTWTTVHSGGGKYFPFVDRFNNVWTTWESWSANKSKMSLLVGGNWVNKITLRDVKAGGAAGDGSQIYGDWGMDYGGGIWALGVNSQYSSGGAYTSVNSNNYVYWSRDKDNWNTIPDFPGASPDRHIHVVRYNEESKLWFVTVGDYDKRSYVANAEDSFEDGFSEIGVIRGGCTGYAPHGGYIFWSNDDGSAATIWRTDADGQNGKVVFTLPAAYAASSCFGMCATDDGELWAVYYSSSVPNTFWSSIDGGETWKLEAALASTSLDRIATFEHSALVGDYIWAAQQSGNLPMIRMRRWRL